MLCITSSTRPSTTFFLLALLVGPGLAIKVTWISPSDGDVFASGDTLLGQWYAPKAVVSPSFRLCIPGDTISEDDEDGDSGGDTCGSVVWPTVKQSESDNSYSITMILPDVPSAEHCFLEMKDDFGDTAASPTFAVQPSADTSSAVDGVDDPQAMQASRPSKPAQHSASMSPQSTRPAMSPTLKDPPPQSFSPKMPFQDVSPALPAAKEAVVPASPISSDDAPLTPLTSSEMHPPLPSATNGAITQTPNLAPIQQSPSLDESHLPAPTAAYAVPLSVVLSILVAAGGLSFHQRRKLRAERLQEQEALNARQALSRNSSLNYAGFTALGDERAPTPTSSSWRGPGLPTSRSTSVSRMCAWQRDVSRYGRVGRSTEHEHEHEHDAATTTSTSAMDGDTYVAREDDWRSVASGTTRHNAEALGGLPRREPRHMTREPFHTSRSQARRTTVPASMFRAAASPISLPSESQGGADGAYGRRGYDGEEEDESEWGRLKPKLKRRAYPAADGDRSQGNEYVNAYVGEEIVAGYLDLSPVPLSPAQPARSPPREHQASMLRPQRLHVRRYINDPQ